MQKSMDERDKRENGSEFVNLRERQKMERGEVKREEKVNVPVK